MISASRKAIFSDRRIPPRKDSWQPYMSMDTPKLTITIIFLIFLLIGENPVTGKIHKFMDMHILYRVDFGQ